MVNILHIFFTKTRYSELNKQIRYHYKGKLKQLNRITCLFVKHSGEGAERVVNDFWSILHLEPVQAQPTHFRPMEFVYSNEPLIKTTWSGNCGRLHKKLHSYHKSDLLLDQSSGPTDLYNWIYHS